MSESIFRAITKIQQLLYIVSRKKRSVCVRL